MEKAKSIALILGVLTLSILLSYLVLAWTEPSGPPPTGNVPAPINVGSLQQWKEGGLGVGTKTFDLTSGQIAASTFYDREVNAWSVTPRGTTLLKGLSIGATTTPLYTLDVTGTLRATATTTFAGNVGIGTASTEAKLTVAGDLKVTKKADISEWAHSNIVTNFNADKLDGYNASDLLAAGAGGWDPSDFSLIGTATFEAQATGTKTIGTFTKTELACVFSSSPTTTIVITANPPASNPTGYEAKPTITHSSQCTGVSKVLLIKIVNSTGTDSTKIWDVFSCSCTLAAGYYPPWSYELFLKGDGTLIITKYCPYSPTLNGYTHFTCYER